MMGKTYLKVTYTSSFEQSRNLAHFKSICIEADKRHACVGSGSEVPLSISNGLAKQFKNRVRR